MSGQQTCVVWPALCLHALCLFAVSSCDSHAPAAGPSGAQAGAIESGSPASARASSRATSANDTAAPKVRTRYPAAKRLIALGDVHGDLRATRAALKLGGLIDDEDRWAGGDSVLVQTGDVLDRGNGERAIIELLISLQEQAAAAGGRVHLLHGNHELMNVAADFRYVTPGGMRDFDAVAPASVDQALLARVRPAWRQRAMAWLPGGAYARKLATHPVVVVVGQTVFAHGGVLPKHVKELGRINTETSRWLLGLSPGGMRVVQASDSPVWTRHFSDEPDGADCKLLAESLSKLGVARMVVGHTVQPTIRPACDNRVWRVDVGMSRHYGGQPEVLEITAGGVRALRGDGRAKGGA